MSTEPNSYFTLTGAADDRRPVRHPMSDLAELEATLDEMEARRDGRESLVTTHDQLQAMAPQIWSNYRKGKGTPLPKGRK
jgi:hypothetical protein